MGFSAMQPSFCGGVTKQLWGEGGPDGNQSHVTGAGGGNFSSHSLFRIKTGPSGCCEAQAREELYVFLPELKGLRKVLLLGKWYSGGRRKKNQINI